jgi:hypothetical protein
MIVGDSKVNSIIIDARQDPRSKRNIISSRPLHPTSLETTAENLLELRDVLEVHERVVLPRHISVRCLAAAEVRPWLQLVVKPVNLGSGKGNGIENVQCG